MGSMKPGNISPRIISRWCAEFWGIYTKIMKRLKKRSMKSDLSNNSGVSSKKPRSWWICTINTKTRFSSPRRSTTTLNSTIKSRKGSKFTKIFIWKMWARICSISRIVSYTCPGRTKTRKSRSSRSTACSKSSNPSANRGKSPFSGPTTRNIFFCSKDTKISAKTSAWCNFWPS